MDKDKAKKQTPQPVIDKSTAVSHNKPSPLPRLTYESLKTIEVTNEISGNDVRIFDKTPSKDVEMYSGIPNLIIKLNKTKNKNSISKETISSTTSVLELVHDPKSDAEEILIDPKLEDLNANFSENNESEIFIPTPTKYSSEHLEKQNDSNKEVKMFVKSTSEEHKGTVTEESLEPIPQPHPKPNRKRQLSRPQSRSFYPYFFSRVLG